MQKHFTVDEFLKSLSAEQKNIVELLRAYIRESNSSLQENIKWNAPNYVLHGNDRITFNTMNKNKSIRIILHMGAKEKEDKNAPPVMDDSTGIILWNSNIRGTLEFTSFEEVKKYHKEITTILIKWLSI